MPTKTITMIQAKAAALLKEAEAAPESGRAPLYLAVAELFLDARQFFYLRDGSADILGRSHAYRAWVREVYAEAEIPKERISTLQGAIRYHSGNALRERLDPDELEAHGLLKTAPRDRSVVDREQRSEILALVDGGAPLSDIGEVTALLELFDRALDRIAPEALAGTGVAEALNRLHDHLAEIRVDLVAP